MANARSVHFICEQALRKIGAYSINDTAARGVEMDVAREWLDMVVAAILARRRAWWMVPIARVVPLLGNVGQYDLNTLVGREAAPDGVQFGISLHLIERSTGALMGEVPLVRREEWEGISRPAAERGVPSAAHITRDTQPVLYLHPPPAADGVLDLRITFQKVAPDLIASRFIEGETGFRRAWELCLVTMLAAELSDGPVRKAPQDEVRDLRTIGARLLYDLEAYDADEQQNTPELIRSSDPRWA